MKKPRFPENLSPQEQKILHDLLLKRILDADTTEPQTMAQIMRDEIGKRFPRLVSAVQNLKKINLDFPPKQTLLSKNIIPEFIRVQIRKIIGDR